LALCISLVFNIPLPLAALFGSVFLRALTQRLLRLLRILRDACHLYSVRRRFFFHFGGALPAHVHAFVKATLFKVF
jgi:hypothetical protein